MLSALLPGTWELLSRIDTNDAGERRVDPSLGDDPIALLIYDRAGHFAAQFMKRDRSVIVETDAAPAAQNNSRARGGYDAYFGTYTVDGEKRVVTHHVEGSLAPDFTGTDQSRPFKLEGDRLEIGDGKTWRRVLERVR